AGRGGARHRGVGAPAGRGAGRRVRRRGVRPRASDTTAPVAGAGNKGAAAESVGAMVTATGRPAPASPAVARRAAGVVALQGRAQRCAQLLAGAGERAEPSAVL